MRLNLGCGNGAMEGYVNVDLRPLSGVDVVCDLDDGPWPFKDSAAEQILALDIFEHLEDVIGAMDECHRILASGGELIIRGPLAGSLWVWSDVTHRRAFTELSFDHFDPETHLGQAMDYGRGKWRKVKVDISPKRYNVIFLLEPRK